MQAVRLINVSESCSVEFIICPLFEVVNDLSHWRGYNISEWRSGKMKKWQWYFTPFSQSSKNSEGIFETVVINDGSIEDIVDDMLSIFLLHVMPIFEKAIDFESMFIEVKKLELLLYGEETSSVFDNRRYWWYIKKGDYKKAIQCLQFVITEAQPISKEKFTKLGWIKTSEKQLCQYKLKLELVKSKNHEHTRLDIISRENIDADFRKQLVSGDIIIKDYETPTYIRRMIRDLEKHLKLAEDENSRWSKELKEIEAMHISGEEIQQEKISQMQRVIELLSIPDTDYFLQVIANNETKSHDYLNSPSKFNRRVRHF